MVFLNELPTEVLQIILCNLTLRDRLRYEAVSKQFYEIMPYKFHALNLCEILTLHKWEAAIPYLLEKARAALEDTTLTGVKIRVFSTYKTYVPKCYDSGSNMDALLKLLQLSGVQVLKSTNPAVLRGITQAYFPDLRELRFCYYGDDSMKGDVLNNLLVNCAQYLPRLEILHCTFRWLPESLPVGLKCLTLESWILDTDYSTRFVLTVAQRKELNKATWLRKPPVKLKKFSSNMPSLNNFPPLPNLNDLVIAGSEPFEFFCSLGRLAPNLVMLKLDQPMKDSQELPLKGILLPHLTCLTCCNLSEQCLLRIMQALVVPCLRQFSFETATLSMCQEILQRYSCVKQLAIAGQAEESQWIEFFGNCDDIDQVELNENALPALAAARSKLSHVFVATAMDYFIDSFWLLSLFDRLEAVQTQSVQKRVRLVYPYESCISKQTVLQFGELGFSIEFEKRVFQSIHQRVTVGSSTPGFRCQIMI